MTTAQKPEAQAVAPDERRRFPNRAGDRPDTDDILRAELRAAGIQTMQEAEGKPPEFMAEMLRRNSGEVKTSVIGVLHGWTFKRAWYYWMANGPGIEIEAAERLHATHGTSVRVDGHCGCPSPREWFNGLACGSYHVDDAEGLRALADCIKALVSGERPDRATLDAAVAEAVAMERERCAKVCEASRPAGGLDVMQSACFDALTRVAAAIRRTTQDTPT